MRETMNVLLIRAGLIGGGNPRGSHGLNEGQVLHSQAERISSSGNNGSRSRLSVEGRAKEHLRAGAGSDGATHVSGQERQSDLIRSVHPTEAFTWDHLEIDALVPVLCVNQMRKLHGVKLQEATVRKCSLRILEAESTNLLRYDTVKVNERGGHHVKEPIREPLGIL